MSDLKKKMDKGAAYLKRNGIRQTLLRVKRKAALSRPVNYEKWIKQHSADQTECARQKKEELWRKVTVSALLFPGTTEEENRTRKSIEQQTFGPIPVYTPDIWMQRKERREDAVLLIQAGALLRPEAVYQMLKRKGNRQKTFLLYTDHDICRPDGQPDFPFCKPDYDSILQGQMNYLGPVLLASSDLLADMDVKNPVTVWRNLTEKSDQIDHLPEILYHVSESMEQEMEQIHWNREKEQKEDPLVSVIIPNKDHAKDLACCIDSILESGGYAHLEILIVENNSTEPETFRKYEQLQKKDHRIRVITWKGTFNYSAINNDAARQAGGAYFLFLNNDTKIKEKGAIREMVSCALDAQAGAVGCRLVYADKTIQHAGVVLGYGGVAGHAFEGMREEDYERQRYARVIRQMSAVTAACMLVKKEAFWESGGFTEELGVAYNDIDLCLKLQSRGYMVLYDPKAQLYHYESQTRGFEMTEQKAKRVRQEAEYFCRTWKKELTQGDRFYNSNLTLEKPDFSLKR